MEKLRLLFSLKEDPTDLNLLLRKLLNEKSIEESLKLKEELDSKYKEIMQEELVKKTNEVNLISNFFK